MKEDFELLRKLKILPESLRSQEFESFQAEVLVLAQHDFDQKNGEELWNSVISSLYFLGKSVGPNSDDEVRRKAKNEAKSELKDYGLSLFRELATESQRAKMARVLSAVVSARKMDYEWGSDLRKRLSIELVHENSPALLVDFVDYEPYKVFFKKLRNLIRGFGVSLEGLGKGVTTDRKRTLDTLEDRYLEPWSAEKARQFICSFFETAIAAFGKNLLPEGDVESVLYYICSNAYDVWDNLLDPQKYAQLEARIKEGLKRPPCRPREEFLNASIKVLDDCFNELQVAYKDEKIRQFIGLLYDLEERPLAGEDGLRTYRQRLRDLRRRGAASNEGEDRKVPEIFLDIITYLACEPPNPTLK